MAWSTAARITLAEVVTPILTRLGVTRWAFYGRLEAMMLGIEIGNPFAVFAMLRNILAASPLLKGSFAAAIFYYLDEIQNIKHAGEQTFKNIYDDYSGDIKTYIIVAGSEFIREAIRKATEQKTGVGLTIRTFYPITAETVEEIGADIGTWLALVANAKIGTNFTSLYPPENLKTEIQNQVIAELTTGGRVLLSEANVQAILTGLQQVRDGQLVQQYGLLASQGIPIPPEQVVETKAARRRAQLREAQRNYRLTHTRTYGPWTHI